MAPAGTDIFQSRSWGWWRGLRAKLRTAAQRMALGLFGVLSADFAASEGALLVVAPHQDDETLACGGLIALKRRRGAAVKVVFITDGRASHRGQALISETALTNIRREEAVAALAKLAVLPADIVFLGLPDQGLINLPASARAAARDALAEVLRGFAPREVAVPFRHDAHPDHRFTHALIGDAIADAAVEPVLLEYLIASLWSPWLLLPAGLRGMSIRRLSVREVLYKKLEAISCYRSQFRPLGPYAHSALPRAYAELFSVGEEFFVVAKTNAAGSSIL